MQTEQKKTYQIFINLHIIFIFVTDSARRAGSSNFMSLRLALHPRKLRADADGMMIVSSLLVGIRLTAAGYDYF